METIIEQKKESGIVQFARDGQDYKGYKTEMEEMAERAIKSTQKVSYYNNLPAIKAIPQSQRQGVMDSYVSYFQNSQQFMQYYAQNRFMGYAFLSYLAQDAMISRGVHTLADEMTREWGELSTKEKENENIVQAVLDEMDRLETQNKFKDAAIKTGFFGGCLVFLDVREDPNIPLEDIELEKPLFKEGMDEFNKSKLLGKHLVGLRVIEPINLAPGVYNSIDPTADDFFEPEHFYVLGRKIHKSRFLYFADNIPPQVLKPVYLFFGIPLAQLAFTYVQDFYKAKDVCTRILQKFSCSAISTDIEKLIYANGKNAVKDRISTIAKYRDNDSILVLDKENEEFSQTNTPLGGLKEMWYASLELIPMIFGIPATKLLEISPSGFNSTGEFEMRNFYDSVHTKQSNVFDAPLKRLLEVICYTKGFDPDILAWSWKSLFKMSDKETAEVNRMEADTAQIYYNMGVVGNDDIAKRLINDKDSGYNNIEIPERIDPFQVGEEGPEVPEEETEETDTEETTEENSDIEKSDVKDEAPKKKVGILGRLFGMFDADRWITIHPPHGNKEDKGVPLKIGEDGEVKAGAGGKFTGKKIDDINRKKVNNYFNDNKSAKKYAENNGVKLAEYEDFTPEIYNTINEAIMTLPKDDRPHFVSSFKNAEKRGILKGDILKHSKKSFGLSWNPLLFITSGNKIIESDRNIFFNSSYKSLKEIEKHKKEFNKNNFTGKPWYFNEDGKASFFHEIGHQYADKYGISEEFKKLADKWANSTIYGNIKKVEYGKIKENKGANYPEAFAEAYAGYFTKNPNLPEYIKDYIEKEIKKAQSRKQIPNKLKNLFENL